jgi:membrane protease YdiL (CAAX protease family)
MYRSSGVPRAIPGSSARESPLVQAVTASQRDSPLIVTWICGFGVPVVGGLGLSRLISVTILGDPADGSVKAQWAEAITAVLTLSLLALWVRLGEHRAFSTIGFLGPARDGVRRFAVGFLGGLVLLTLPVTALVTIGMYANGASEHPGVGSAATGTELGILLSIVLVWILQASAEEAVMRGYLLQWHAIKLDAWQAIAFTSAIFSLAHLNVHPLPLVNTFLIGIALCFVSLGQGSIWLACGIHAGWNLAQGSIFGLAVSGTSYDVSLLSLGPTKGSADWLTGGQYGVEGSLATTVVLLVVAAASYSYYRNIQARREASGSLALKRPVRISSQGAPSRGRPPCPPDAPQHADGAPPGEPRTRP